MTECWIFTATIVLIPLGAFVLSCSETMFMTAREARQYRQWQREGKL